jgi:hypothetical protein
MRIRASFACGLLAAIMLLLAACGPAPTPTAVFVVLATVTETLMPSPTPSPTPTAMPTVASVAAPTAVPTVASAGMPTDTPTLSSLSTPTATTMETTTPAYTATPTNTPTSTALPTSTPTPTPTPTPQPTQETAPGLSNDLIGTWREENGSYWQFKEDGTFCLGGAPPALCQDPMTSGVFWLEGTQLAIRDTGGLSVCGPGSGDPQWDGVYVLFLVPKEMFSLMLVYDQCPSRTETATRSLWYWVSP